MSLNTSATTTTTTNTHNASNTSQRQSRHTHNHDACSERPEHVGPHARTTNWHLLDVSQIPSWMRDNDFLHTGYRPPQPTILSCLSTALLRFSNDSVNIYTHFLGFLFMLPLSLYILFRLVSSSALLSSLPSVSLRPSCLLPTTLSESPLLSSYAAMRESGVSALSCVNAVALRALLWEHRLALLPLLVSGACCLCFSACFHIFWVRSKRAMRTLAKFDFVGIATLCMGHAITGTYYMFYCSLRSMRVFFVAITIAFLATLPLCLAERFATPEARPLRGLAFSTLGALSLFPIGKALLSAYHHDISGQVAISSTIIALLAYGAGAAAYVSRFPECCKSRNGKHDRYFASHQLLHVFVLCGIAVHLTGCVYLMRIRVMHGCPLS